MKRRHIVAFVTTTVAAVAAGVLAAPTASASHNYCYSQHTRLRLVNNHVEGSGGAYCVGGGAMSVKVNLSEYLNGAYRLQATSTKVGIMFNDYVTVSGPRCL